MIKMDTTSPPVLTATADDLLLTPEAVAKRLAIEPQTLTAWRCKRRDRLPFVKIGRLVRYRPSDVSAFIESRLRAA